MSSDNEVKEVRMEKIQSSITCPLCKLPFIEATTIYECIHTFCKRCIYDKITNENLKVCPVCNVELGTTPLSKLRSDNKLQVLCDIILASAGKKSKEMRSKVPVSCQILQNERKEEPLTSLVDKIPKSSNHNITSKTSSKCTRIKRGEQFCHKNEASSSNPPTNIVIHQKIQGNDGGIEIARLSERILCDLNKLPIIIDEDGTNPESIAQNVSHELKVEDKDTDPYNIEDDITNTEHGITNTEDGITNAATKREIDLNELLNPSTIEENAQILDLNKNENTNDPPNQPIEENAPTHDHTKNEAITASDTPDNEKETIYIIIDDSD